MRRNLLRTACTAAVVYVIVFTLAILVDDASETMFNDRTAAKSNEGNDARKHTGYHVGKTGSGEAPGVSVTWIPHLCPRYKVKKGGEPADHRQLTWMPPTEDAIFFTQTSCSTSLTRREACAVESAALHHPHRPVLVFMTAPALNHTHPLIKVLAGLRNVQLAWLDLDLVFGEEPLRTWHRDRLWMLSDRGMSTVVSDAARVELLRRHGGTYIDLDAFSLRPLPASTSTNWLARIDDRLVGNAIMSFAAGHSFLQAVVADIPSAFEPSSCCSVGPDLLTRHLQRLCPQNITTNNPASVGIDHTETCGNITVWPSKLFCPIHYGYLRHQLPSLVREGEGLGPAFFKTSEAFSLHLFHSLSQRRPVSLDGDSILMEAAARNCPRVVKVLRRHKTYL